MPQTDVPLSLYVPQQASVPMSSLDSLSFLLSFFGKALVWQRWVCHLVFSSCKKQLLQFWCATFFFLFLNKQLCHQGGRASRRRKLSTVILLPKWFLEKLLKHQFPIFGTKNNFGTFFQFLVKKPGVFNFSNQFQFRG